MHIELVNKTTHTGYYLYKRPDGEVMFAQGRNEVYNNLHSVPFYPNILEEHAKLMVDIFDEAPGDSYEVRCFRTDPDQSVLTNRVVTVTHDSVEYNKHTGQVKFHAISNKGGM